VQFYLDLFRFDIFAICCLGGYFFLDTVYQCMLRCCNARNGEARVIEVRLSHELYQAPENMYLSLNLPSTICDLILSLDPSLHRRLLSNIVLTGVNFSSSSSSSTNMSSIIPEANGLFNEFAQISFLHAPETWRRSNQKRHHQMRFSSSKFTENAFAAGALCRTLLCEIKLFSSPRTSVNVGLTK